MTMLMNPGSRLSSSLALHRYRGWDCRERGRDRLGGSREQKPQLGEPRTSPLVSQVPGGSPAATKEGAFLSDGLMVSQEPPAVISGVPGPRTHGGGGRWEQGVCKRRRCYKAVPTILKPCFSKLLSCKGLFSWPQPLSPPNSTPEIPGCEPISVASESCFPPCSPRALLGAAGASCLLGSCCHGDSHLSCGLGLLPWCHLAPLNIPLCLSWD